RLAVAALRHVDLGPRALHRVRAVARQPFDRDDAVVGADARDRDRTRTPHVVIDVHRARPALRDAATVLGAGETDLLAQNPQQRRVGLDLDVVRPAVDVQLGHGRSPRAAGRESVPRGWHAQARSPEGPAVIIALPGVPPPYARWLLRRSVR